MEIQKKAIDLAFISKLFSGMTHKDRVVSSNRHGMGWLKRQFKSDKSVSQETSFHYRLEVGKVSRGLSSLCKTRLGDKVLVLADTKAEWMVTALSCFQAGCTVVTLYTTMSDEAIKYGLEQTEAAVVFTDQDILPRLTSILKGK